MLTSTLWISSPRAIEPPHRWQRPPLRLRATAITLGI
jgi:hypothetical protein